MCKNVKYQKKCPPSLSGSGPRHRARGGEVSEEPNPAPAERAAAGREPGRRGGGGLQETAADGAQDGRGPHGLRGNRSKAGLKKH